jgi:hypothetical protein
VLVLVTPSCVISLVAVVVPKEVESVVDRFCT